MWIEDPIAHFGKGEVEPTTLDPLEAVQHPVVLASNPKHFYALETLVRMIESGKALNPVTRAPFTLDDIRPLVTPATLPRDYADLVQLLIAFGWSKAHLAVDAAHIVPKPMGWIDRFQRVWRVMVEHWARLPLVDVNEMHARWTREAAFDSNVGQTRAAELLLAARRCDYANNSAAELHRLADRFVGLMQLFCGRHTNVVVRRRQLIHGFAFLAWRRGLPVRFETAYRFMDLRIESDRCDMQNFVLRPSTAHDAVRRALAGLTPEERHRLRSFQPAERVSLQLEAAIARAPARRRYSTAELLTAAVPTFMESGASGRLRLTPIALALSRMGPPFTTTERVPPHLYVMLVRHVEERGVCVPIEAALRSLVGAPITLFARR